MDALHQQIRNIDFSNWLDVAVAISVTTKGISEYLESTILALHQEIKNGACALLPNCKQNCSKTLRNFSTWCPTCVKWKGQIKSYNKYRNRERKIKWGDINSSDWPRNVDEMVKVFAPEWWRARTPYTEDLSVALHVIQNCTKFNIPVLICQRVRDVRNALFAHGHLQVDNAEKKNAFRILLTILKLPEISQTRSGRLAISQLKRLKSKCVIDLMTEDEAFRHHLVLALNPYKDTDREILNQYEHVKELRLCLREDQNGQLQRILTERTRIVGRVYGNGRFAIALIISFICIIIILLNIGHRDDTTWEGLHNEKGCLPMTFSSPCPWKPDFTFDGYLTNRPILIGRNWLIDKIQTSLFGTSSRGILLTAEMGYGLLLWRGYMD
ncbi:uncharacterized protein LOC117340258 [Pecten maximus]|uniref:uncharacterized protein LOC117340258 n=1 Tax=Pecten maximus TaxID=6579 RepID=UPI001458C07C|nr:uncharacterized protein LOC117340258 [Pecten maximus]